MQAASLDLTIEQGATFRQLFRWQDKTKTPFNLTGYTAKLMARATLTSPTALLNMTTENGDITLDGPAGKITLALTPEETAKLRWDTAVYDMTLTSPSGDVYRLIEGQIIVSKAVTR